MKRRWRSFWFFVGLLPLLLALWLVWVLPDLGFFRLDTDSFSLPHDGVVLLERKAGKVASSFPDGTSRVIKHLVAPTPVVPGQRRVRVKR